VACWVAEADTGSEGWSQLYLQTLLDNGVTSMGRARELIEDAGDLREWQIKKGTANRLFEVLRWDASK
jgi:hypothetical protein